MITLKEAITLAEQAHKGQWRRPTYLPQGPGKLITDTVMSDMMYGSMLGEAQILKCGRRLTYCPSYKQWHIAEPYITHPLAVMGMMDTDEEKIVAVLHDVIEDTEWILYPFGGLWIKHPETKVVFKLPKTIYIALYKLTKFNGDGKSYKQHILDIDKDKLATKVKIVDMMHNMSQTQSEKQKQKYLEALPILLKGL